jgi:periplasmic copper chaperone A
MPRILSRVLAVGGAAGLLVAGLAGPALAHVTVDSPGATQGGFAVITFRVPNETENTDSVGLKVQLPKDQPLGSVSVKPLAGWTYKVEQAKLDKPITTDDGQVTEAPSVITWTAARGQGIKPGEYNDFQISAGPLPAADQMVFKAIQTYSDGKTVDWIDEAAPGAAEPEHPAPTLQLAKAAPAGGAAPSAAPTVSAGPAATSGGASSGSVAGAYVVGALGLLVGLAGLALGARRRGGNVAGVHQQPVGTKAE